ncbi:MAG: carbohydrate ABC transporter permease [Spirochaetia bacterium]|jgi:raffinose/stachyose/melibiose transport system permease protein|nr:carbohydrate ABC transporter permease [uncultured Sphaerochaeta sp.]MDD3058158.1 carbohydrate ABC transporter permease [Sphaerochaeta sp.]NCC13135.1 carbohydrate ABC transporter permease [Spirochaetia bacterium]NCC90200.1 carbohydrate ABC transporter permease [Spirochaetia bacterium]NLK06306.1 carbohydrate ABC transporter permease [Spirochaetales bacterium]
MKKYTPASTFTTLILSVVALFYLYPLFLVVINSFKTFSEITSNVLALPKSLVFENFSNAFRIMNYPQYFLNTLLATAVGVSGVVLVSSMAGYKLSRTKTRYSFVMFMVLIAPMMIPFHSFMISLVKVAKELHLIGSPLGLGVLYWGLGASLALFMYHGAVKSVPQELDDCALIDGAGPLRAFFQIIFPLLQPVTVSVIVINTMWMWNDFLLPLLVLSGSKKSLTLQLAAYNFFGLYKVDWNFAMAGVLLTILPAVIFYLSLQRYIIKGMVAGAVKT